MVKTCIVSGCHQKFVKNGPISFYSIPKDNDRRSRWLAALNQKNLEVKNFHVICSKHFKDCDYNIDTSNRKNLKPYAVPSIFENRPKRTTVRAKQKPDNPTQYNFRTRNVPVQARKKIQKTDHTYYTLKPMPPEPRKSNHTSTTSNLHQPFNDHLYTRLTESAAAPTSIISHHNEHNYSKKRIKTIEAAVQQSNDAYLGSGEFIRPNANHIIVQTAAVEPVVLDLRDHTYSKNNKRVKSTKKAKEALKELNLPEGNVDCIIVTPVAKESMPASEFNSIKNGLCVLEVKDACKDVNTFAPFATDYTYVLVDPKNLKRDQADENMKVANELLKDIFGGTPPSDKNVPDDAKLCCEKFKSDDILKHCAVRRRFTAPRNIGDFNLNDMFCAKNAKRYYELAKVRMDSQKFLIQKLRKQNNRLSSRFHTLGEEILRIKRGNKSKLGSKSKESLKTAQ